MINPAIQYENYYKGAWDLADKSEELQESYEEFFEEEGIPVDDIIRDVLESLARDIVADEISTAGSVTRIEALLEDIGLMRLRQRRS